MTLYGTTVYLTLTRLTRVCFFVLLFDQALQEYMRPGAPRGGEQGRRRILALQLPLFDEDDRYSSAALHRTHCGRGNQTRRDVLHRVRAMWWWESQYYREQQGLPMRGPRTCGDLPPTPKGGMSPQCATVEGTRSTCDPPLNALCRSPVR